MQVIGLDIGGANLKAATSAGKALTQNFDLWRAPDQLSQMLSTLLARLPPPAALAVTMTAELADCFATKAEGVDAILRAVEHVAGSVPVLVWQTSGSFASPDQARSQPLEVAASNWHALATWAGRFAPAGAAILVDIGSTTTDIIPLWNGVPTPQGRTDCTRLLAGELTYTGVRRTPLCAIADAVPYRGQNCPIAAELFATTLDVYLTLGQIAEDSADTNTADGRPATRSAAHDRLARMLCCDRTELSAEDAAVMAAFLATAQQTKLMTALDAVLARLPGPCTTAIISGSGSFLAAQLLQQHPALRDCRMVSLRDRFSPELAEAACAYATAILATGLGYACA